MQRVAPPPEVQFVSKPMVAPFRDGSKCLVRDLCLHLEGVTPHVMGAGAAAPELGARVVSHPVYASSGGFSPALRQNLQAAWFLMTKSRADLWHFVFAPNPRSSGVGAKLKSWRKVPTVQTIASPPRTFERPDQLLFGDVAVAQSAWTKKQFELAFERDNKPAPKIELVLPPAPDVAAPSEDEIQKARLAFGCQPAQPLFLYPGDLEVSHGAEKVVALSHRIRQKVPFARVVLAYRDKTPRAHERATELADKSNLEVVRFGCNVPNIHALVAGATAVVFPVDDLYGKVDLPIVLLEAFRLGTPVIALNEGPLQSLAGAELLPDDEGLWLEAMARLAEDGRAVEIRREKARAALAEHYLPSIIAKKYATIYQELLEKTR